jgi:hypothetical protein
MSQPPVSVVYAATLSLLKKESSKFKVQSSKFINHQLSSSIINNPLVGFGSNSTKTPTFTQHDFFIQNSKFKIQIWRITA